MYFSKKKDHSINMIQTWYVDINIKKTTTNTCTCIARQIALSNNCFIFPR